ncbi:MAG: EutN/CcmL family microcompartment protein [Eubacteriales bacterium]
MYIAKVIGNVVSTTKCEKLTGLKLLLVQQIDMLTMKESGTPVVITDSVGAGVGEVVMVVTGGSARLTETTTGKPVDATTVGIIDTIEIEGRMLFEKYPHKEESIEETAPDKPIEITEPEKPLKNKRTKKPLSEV